jgi:hypothetical protein
MHTVYFEHVAYLGGLKTAPTYSEGVLRFEAETVALVSQFDRSEIPWDEIAQVNLDDMTTAKNKVAAVAMFGVLGLAAKGSTSGTSIEIVLHDDSHVFFRAKKTAVDRSRAVLLPVLHDHGLDKPAPAALGVDTSGVDALERLASLHASGALDDVEFKAAKARLLGL